MKGNESEMGHRVSLGDRLEGETQAGQSRIRAAGNPGERAPPQSLMRLIRDSVYIFSFTGHETKPASQLAGGEKKAGRIKREGGSGEKM